MSEPINDGGPAYPTPETDTYNIHFGMSLRDYFAAAALQGLLACANWHTNGDWQDSYETDAYILADAMLAAREGK